MQILDNINFLWGDDLKKSMEPGSRLKIAASCFSIYAYEALKNELETIDSLEFIFTAPAFVPNEVTDKISKEKREFHIPKQEREKNLYGSEFEIRLKNKLTQKAIARECADWIRRKAKFRSNTSRAPMQPFACLNTGGKETAYVPLHGFTAVDLGYQQGNAVSNFINKMDAAPITSTYVQLFDQIWNDHSKLEDVTDSICDHIESVYQENSPEKIYFLMLYNIFTEFLEDLNEDVLPNDRTGYKNSLVWNKLFNFQRDAATGIINKLESYNGCILADSVGIGKTFTALAVIKYYELRNRSVLVLCPKKLADNWMNYNHNLKTNILAKDRLNYDVLCHTDLQRTSGESFGTPLNKVNWGNYDLVVIDESHNFRNNEAYRERETRYQKLMNSVIRDGVKTKVLMLSATPVNNRFNDLRNQLALAYEGESENLSKKLKTGKSIEEIFRAAQTAFNQWSKLPPENRTARAILDALDFDFFELLDSVTIAEISKERIRRAGKKILKEMASKDKPKTKDDQTGDLFTEPVRDNFSDFRVFRGSNKLDTGFRVLKVDSGNMADIYYTPDALSQDGLFNLTDNIKSDRSEEELLFQVLLDWGVDLTYPITKETIDTNDVYFVDNNALAACFVKKGRVTEAFCKELAKRQPLRVVFRDAGFKDGSVKINVEQIFKLMSPHTDVRTI